MTAEGAIGVVRTEQEGNMPARTVYEITELGSETVRVWLRTMLGTLEPDFPDFPAALATVALLEPEEVLAELERRAEALEARLAESDGSDLGLPRLFVIEDEYQRAVTRAELGWVRSVIDDLRSGRLTWSEELLGRYAEQFGRQPES